MARTKVDGSFAALRAATSTASGAPAGTPKLDNSSADAGAAGLPTGTPLGITRTRSGCTPARNRPSTPARLTEINRCARAYFQRVGRLFLSGVLTRRANTILARVPTDASAARAIV